MSYLFKLYRKYAFCPLKENYVPAGQFLWLGLAARQLADKPGQHNAESGSCLVGT